MHVGSQPVGSVTEGVETATEATACDFLDGKAVGVHHSGVHETGALVIGDETDLETFGVEGLGELENGGGLSRAEEAANHDVVCRHMEN